MVWRLSLAQDQVAGIDDAAQKEYTLHIIEEKNDSSWYPEECLELVEIDRLDLLPENHRISKSLQAKKERDENLKKSKATEVKP